MIKLNLSLRAKLLLAFAFITALGMFSNIFGYVSMKHVNATSTVVHEAVTKPLINLIKITDSFQRVGVHMRDAYLAKNEALANKSLSTIEGLMSTISLQADEYAASLISTEEKDAFADFKTRLAAYQETINTVSQYTSSENEMEIKQQLNALKSSALLLQISIEGMIDQKIARSDLVQEESSLTLTSTVAVFSIAGLLGMLFALVSGLMISNSIANAVKKMALLAKIVASGDLSQDIDPRVRARGDELGSLAGSIETMKMAFEDNISRLKASIATLESIGMNLETSTGITSDAVDHISRSIDSAKNQVLEQSAGVTETSATTDGILQSIQNLDREIENQAASVTESSASVEQMVGNIQTVTRNINNLSSNFALLKSASEQGNNKIQGMMAQIQTISTQSENLLQANSTIASIAAQTNLLAMNAAIEAAHAGQAGMGFAVVADEIRKLAELSARQSKEVSRDIKQIRGTIDTMVGSSGDTSRAFSSILERIETLSIMEQEISRAMLEQSEGSRQVLEAISSINSVTANVRRSSTEISIGSQSIATEMQDLNRGSVSLSDAMHLIDQGTTSIQNAARQVKDACSQTTTTVRELASIIADFKVRE